MITKPFFTLQNTPMKIRFFSDFCETKEINIQMQLIWKAKDMCSHYGYEIVDTDEYTHAILINTANPILTIPKENVIGLAYEPPFFLPRLLDYISYAQKHISIYYIGQTSFPSGLLLPPPFTEGYGFLWHCQVDSSLLLSNVRQNPISIMVSQKMIAPGHKYRYELAMALAMKNIPIHIFGRGSAILRDKIPIQYSNVVCKGAFTDPSVMYKNYYFHIAIENFQTPNYISEKVIDSLLYECVPCYLGASTISNIFPQMTFRLVGNVDYDVYMIQTLLHNVENNYSKFYKNATEVSNKVNLLQYICHPLLDNSIVI